jgi:hypothetical protein
MSHHELPPPAVMMNLIVGKFVTHLVAAAAHMGIADRLKDETKSADDVAQGAGTDADATYRVMRALAMVGVLAEHEGKRFSLTPVGACLRTDVPGSLAGMAKFMGEGFHSAAWAEIMHSVRTGRSGFVEAHGASLFEWAIQHREQAEVFNRAMTSFSQSTAPLVAAAFDFSKAKRIADVGGGHGFLLTTILCANANAHGVLYELPQVADGAKRAIAESGLAARCEVTPGDFFEGAPAGCDVVLLKHILHDWPDDACVKILSNIARAMTPDGRVLVVEQVMTPPGVPHMAKMIDIEMLVMTEGGRERTEPEFAALFARAGLKLVRVVPTPSPVAVIEAARA